jgi:hypothetical protein
MANDYTNTDRVELLRDVYQQSGLNQVLVVRKTEPMAGQYTKMLFELNDFRISSLEVYETQAGPYCRIHWLANISQVLKEKLLTIPGTVVRSTNSTGVNLDGAPMVVAHGLARALSPRHAA